MMALYVPNELKGKTVSQVILTFLTPPVGSLIVAMVATYGIYMVSSFLYVSSVQVGLCARF